MMNPRAASDELFDWQLLAQASTSPNTYMRQPCPSPGFGHASLDAPQGPRSSPAWLHHQHPQQVDSTVQSNKDIKSWNGTALAPLATGFSSLMTDAHGTPSSPKTPSACSYEHVQIPDTGLSPDAYLYTRGWNDEQRRLASAGLYLSPNEKHMSYISSAPPSMASGPSSAVDYNQPLTRPSSSNGGSHGANILRQTSTPSLQMGTSMAQGLPHSTQADVLYSRSPISEINFVAMGSAFNGSASSQGYPTPASSSAAFLSPLLPQRMERSVSGASSTSCTTAASYSECRTREWRKKRTLRIAKANKICPKMEDTTSMRLASSRAHKEREGYVASRTPYQRPRGPKLTCDECQEHPEGFRGKHELFRHINAKHRGVVKKFRCRDPSTAGFVSVLEAVQPLSDCKACSSGKLYGAYYNAAAHLRRAHFKPKTHRTKDKASDAEGKSGKSNGDWPPMSDLKPWFEAVEVRVDNDTTPIESPTTSCDSIVVAHGPFDQASCSEVEENVPDCDEWLECRDSMQDEQCGNEASHQPALSICDTTLADGSHSNDFSFFTNDLSFQSEDSIPPGDFLIMNVDGNNHAHAHGSGQTLGARQNTLLPNGPSLEGFASEEYPWPFSMQ